MKLAVIALVRNEIDIIGVFLRHLDALFDYAVIMDHGSIDGTDRVVEQACARRPGWTTWHLEPVGYHQGAFSVFALQHLNQHTDADVFVFLDVDEFIDLPDRASLEAALAGLTDPDRVGHLSWRNTVPQHFDTRPISPGEAIWRAPHPSQMGKVVIPRQFFARHHHEMYVGIGNHGLYYSKDHIVPMQHVADILHLPIRSHTQLRSKVLAGVFAVMAQAVREPVQCWHWYDILWRIADGTLRDEDLIGIAVHYSQQGSQTSNPMSWAELQAAGFTQGTLDVAFGRRLPAVTESLSIDPVRLVATVLRRFQVEDVRSSRLMLEGNRVRFVPQESQS